MPVAQAQAVAGPGGEGRYTTPSSDNLNWGTLGMSVYPMGKPHNIRVKYLAGSLYLLGLHNHPTKIDQ